MDDAFELLIFIFVASMFGLALWKVFDLTRTSIKKNKKAYDEDLFDRLAQAFIDHKKETEQRLQHIEAILANKNETSRPSLNESRRAGIEIDEPNLRKDKQNDESRIPNNLRTK